MTDSEIIRQAVTRIRRKANFPNDISFRYHVDTSLEVIVHGKSHVVFNTTNEIYAFLDGFETGLDLLLQK